MTAPTPRSAEAVAREIVISVIGLCYDALGRAVFRDDAVALVAAALTAHATAAVAAERERVRALVQGWADAYSLDIFHPLAEDEAARVNATFPGFSDRCGAHLGRHMAKRLLEDIDAGPQERVP